MTLYMSFVGLGFLLYAGVALANTAIAGFGDRHTVFAFQSGSVASLAASSEAHGGDANVMAGDDSQVVALDGESQAMALGRTLFQERGCAGCHRSDSPGIGPALDGLFGSPVQDPACGVTVVNESYLREAILNPTNTVAMGFLPMMPTFSGHLTEEELQALVVYLKSLRLPVPAPRQ